MTKRKALLGSVAIIALGIWLVPVAPWVQNKLIETLEGQGFKDVALTVSHLGLKGLALSEIKVGKENPLMLKNVTVDYSLSDLRAKRISGVTIDGLALVGYQTKDGWRFEGLESLMQGKKGGTTKIPVTNEELGNLPLNSVEIADSSLELRAEKYKINLPLVAEWQVKPKPLLHYEVPAWEMTPANGQAVSIRTGKAIIDAVLTDKKMWDGVWQLADIKVSNAPMDIPTLSGKGSITAEAERLVVKGKLMSAKSDYRASFTLNYDLKTPDSSTLRITNLRLPWNGGVVGLDAATLPLGGKRATSFTLAVERVSIEELMKSLTGARATGTGLVSGTVPVTIAADGAVRLHEGNLKAVEPGVIAISPETIPGDNAQVALVREVLKNLHYTLLSIAVDSKDDNKLLITMSVEGKNPDVQGGRAVRLNVQLNGDVLNLIQQNVMAVSDPTKLLEQAK